MIGTSWIQFQDPNPSRTFGTTDIFWSTLSELANYTGWTQKSISQVDKKYIRDPQCGTRRWGSLVAQKVHGLAMNKMLPPSAHGRMILQRGRFRQWQHFDYHKPLCAPLQACLAHGAEGQVSAAMAAAFWSPQREMGYVNWLVPPHSHNSQLYPEIQKSWGPQSHLVNQECVTPCHLNRIWLLLPPQVKVS